MPSFFIFLYNVDRFIPFGHELGNRRSREKKKRNSHAIYWFATTREEKQKLRVRLWGTREALFKGQRKHQSLP
jgi:hypothetical protein